jgi:hypothetical protein
MEDRISTFFLPRIKDGDTDSKCSKTNKGKNKKSKKKELIELKIEDVENSSDEESP